MSKNVQISQELFFELVRYFYVEEHSNELYESITKSIEQKIDSIVKHELYTQSKIAKTEEEREQARKKYLDMVGMHKDWRW